MGGPKIDNNGLGSALPPMCEEGPAIASEGHGEVCAEGPAISGDEPMQTLAPPTDPVAEVIDGFLAVNTTLLAPVVEAKTQIEQRAKQFAKTAERQITTALARKDLITIRKEDIAAVKDAGAAAVWAKALERQGYASGDAAAVARLLADEVGIPRAGARITLPHQAVIVTQALQCEAAWAEARKLAAKIVVDAEISGNDQLLLEAQTLQAIVTQPTDPTATSKVRYLDGFQLAADTKWLSHWSQNHGQLRAALTYDRAPELVSMVLDRHAEAVLGRDADALGRSLEHAQLLATQHDLNTLVRDHAGVDVLYFAAAGQLGGDVAQLGAVVEQQIADDRDGTEDLQRVVDFTAAGMEAWYHVSRFDPHDTPGPYVTAANSALRNWLAGAMPEMIGMAASGDMAEAIAATYDRNRTALGNQLRWLGWTTTLERGFSARMSETGAPMHIHYLPPAWEPARTTALEAVALLRSDPAALYGAPQNTAMETVAVQGVETVAEAMLFFEQRRAMQMVVGRYMPAYFWWSKRHLIMTGDGSSTDPSRTYNAAPIPSAYLGLEDAVWANDLSRGWEVLFGTDQPFVPPDDLADALRRGEPPLPIPFTLPDGLSGASPIGDPAVQAGAWDVFQRELGDARTALQKMRIDEFLARAFPTIVTPEEQQRSEAHAATVRFHQALLVHLEQARREGPREYFRQPARAALVANDLRRVAIKERLYAMAKELSNDVEQPPDVRGAWGTLAHQVLFDRWNRDVRDGTTAAERLMQWVRRCEEAERQLTGTHNAQIAAFTTFEAASRLVYQLEALRGARGLVAAAQEVPALQADVQALTAPLMPEGVATYAEQVQHKTHRGTVLARLQASEAQLSDALGAISENASQTWGDYAPFAGRPVERAARASLRPPIGFGVDDLWSDEPFAAAALVDYRDHTTADDLVIAQGEEARQAMMGKEFMAELFFIMTPASFIGNLAKNAARGVKWLADSPKVLRFISSTGFTATSAGMRWAWTGEQDMIRGDQTVLWNIANVAVEVGTNALQDAGLDRVGALTKRTLHAPRATGLIENGATKGAINYAARGERTFLEAASRALSRPTPLRTFLKGSAGLAVEVLYMHGSEGLRQALKAVVQLDPDAFNHWLGEQGQVTSWAKSVGMILGQRPAQKLFQGRQEAAIRWAQKRRFRNSDQGLSRLDRTQWAIQQTDHAIDQTAQLIEAVQKNGVGYEAAMRDLTARLGQLLTQRDALHGQYKQLAPDLADPLAGLTTQVLRGTLGKYREKLADEHPVTDPASATAQKGIAELFQLAARTGTGIELGQGLVFKEGKWVTTLTVGDMDSVNVDGYAAAHVHPKQGQVTFSLADVIHLLVDANQYVALGHGDSPVYRDGAYHHRLYQERGVTDVVVRLDGTEPTFVMTTALQPGQMVQPGEIARTAEIREQLPLRLRQLHWGLATGKLTPDTLPILEALLILRAEPKDAVAMEAIVAQKAGIAEILRDFEIAALSPAEARFFATVIGELFAACKTPAAVAKAIARFANVEITHAVRVEEGRADVAELVQLGKKFTPYVEAIGTLMTPSPLMGEGGREGALSRLQSLARRLLVTEQPRDKDGKPIDDLARRMAIASRGASRHQKALAARLIAALQKLPAADRTEFLENIHQAADLQSLRARYERYRQLQLTVTQHPSAEVIPPLGVHRPADPVVPINAPRDPAPAQPAEGPPVPDVDVVRPASIREKTWEGLRGELPARGYSPAAIELINEVFSRFGDTVAWKCLGIPKEEVEFLLPRLLQHDWTITGELLADYLYFTKADGQYQLGLSPEQRWGLADAESRKDIEVAQGNSLGAVTERMAIEAVLNRSRLFQEVFGTDHLTRYMPLVETPLVDLSLGSTPFLVSLGYGKFESAAGLEFSLYRCVGQPDGTTKRRRVASVGFQESGQGIEILWYQGGKFKGDYETIRESFRTFSGGVDPLPWLAYAVGRHLLGRAKEIGKPLRWIAGERVQMGYPHMPGMAPAGVTTIEEARQAQANPEPHIAPLRAVHEAMLRELEWLQQREPALAGGEEVEGRAYGGPLRTLTAKLQAIDAAIAAAEKDPRRTERLYNRTARKLGFQPTIEDPWRQYIKSPEDFGKGVRSQAEDAARFDASVRVLDEAFRQPTVVVRDQGGKTVHVEWTAESNPIHEAFPLPTEIQVPQDQKKAPRNDDPGSGDATKADGTAEPLPAKNPHPRRLQTDRDDRPRRIDIPADYLRQLRPGGRLLMGSSPDDNLRIDLLESGHFTVHRLPNGKLVLRVNQGTAERWNRTRRTQRIFAGGTIVLQPGDIVTTKEIALQFPSAPFPPSAPSGRQISVDTTIHTFNAHVLAGDPTTLSQGAGVAYHLDRDALEVLSGDGLILHAMVDSASGRIVAIGHRDHLPPDVVHGAVEVVFELFSPRRCKPFHDVAARLLQKKGTLSPAESLGLNRILIGDALASRLDPAVIDTMQETIGAAEKGLVAPLAIEVNRVNQVRIVGDVSKAARGTLEALVGAPFTAMGKKDIEAHRATEMAVPPPHGTTPGPSATDPQDTTRHLPAAPETHDTRTDDTKGGSKLKTDRSDTAPRQPHVVEAIRDERRPAIHTVQEMEDDLRAADATPPDGYYVTGGLKEISDCADCTLFGRVEANLDALLARRRTAGVTAPIRLLTVGPGQGRLEAELKQRYGDEIVIDTFTLTDGIAAENHSAFSTVYLGNLDTHHLPRDYDRILSHRGAYHAVDQGHVLEEVLDSLVEGGEAYYDRAAKTDDTVPQGAQRELLHERYGIHYAEKHHANIDPQGDVLGVRFVYLRKERSLPAAAEALDTAKTIPPYPSRGKYRVTDGGPSVAYADVTFRRHVWECIGKIAAQKQIEIPAIVREVWERDPTAYEELFIHFITWMDADFSVEAAVRKEWPRVSYRFALAAPRPEARRLAEEELVQLKAGRAVEFANGAVTLEWRDEGAYALRAVAQDVHVERYRLIDEYHLPRGGRITVHPFDIIRIGQDRWEVPYLPPSNTPGGTRMKTDMGDRDLNDPVATGSARTEDLAQHAAEAAERSSAHYVSPNAPLSIAILSALRAAWHVLRGKGGKARGAGVTDPLAPTDTPRDAAATPPFTPDEHGAAQVPHLLLHARVADVILDRLSFGAEIRAMTTGRTNDPLHMLRFFLLGECGCWPTRAEAIAVLEAMRSSGYFKELRQSLTRAEFGPPVYEIYTVEFLNTMANDLIARAQEFKRTHGRTPRVVEIVAGDGRLSRGLNERLAAAGLRIAATDLGTGADWGIRHPNDVQLGIDGVVAAAEADIILGSWPPFDAQLADGIADQLRAHPEKTYLHIGNLHDGFWGKRLSHEHGIVTGQPDTLNVTDSGEPLLLSLLTTDGRMVTRVTVARGAPPPGSRLRTDVTENPRVYSRQELVPPGETDAHVTHMERGMFSSYVRRGEVDLRDIRFIHTLSEGRAADLVAEKYDAMHARLGAMKARYAADWERHGPEILADLLHGDREEPDQPPYIAQDAPGHPFLLLNGHRRIATLCLLAARGEIPVAWLQRIPVLIRDLTAPAFVAEITAGVRLRTNEVLEEITVDDRSPAEALPQLESLPVVPPTIQRIELADIPFDEASVFSMEQLFAALDRGEVNATPDEVYIAYLNSRHAKLHGFVPSLVGRLAGRPQLIPQLWMSFERDLVHMWNLVPILHADDPERLLTYLKGQESAANRDAVVAWYLVDCYMAIDRANLATELATTLETNPDVEVRRAAIGVWNRFKISFALKVAALVRMGRRERDPTLRELIGNTLGRYVEAIWSSSEKVGDVQLWWKAAEVLKGTGRIDIAAKADKIAEDFLPWRRKR